jgi:hypothetical protein
MTLTAPDTKNMPSAAEIEASKPLITWLHPAKTPVVLRWLVRRGWRYASGDSDLGWGDAMPAEREHHVLYLPLGNGGPHAAADVVRVYRHSLVVVVGPSKAATMESIAAVRASQIGEGEDAVSTPDDPRLAGCPVWLRGER